MKKSAKLLALILTIVMMGAIMTSCTLFKTEEPPKVEDNIEDGNGQEEKLYSPAIWKVTSASGEGEIYLFGSIHAGDKDMYPLHDEIMNAYNSCDYLAVEADVIAFEENPTAALEVMTPMIYQDGTTIENHISSENYIKAKNTLNELGVYNPVYDLYIPSFWTILIESSTLANISSLNAEKGIDRYFLETAKADGKEIIEIESAKEQYEMLASFSDELQEFLLKDIVDSYESGELKNSLSEAVELWKQGKVDELLSQDTDFEEMTEDEKVLYDEYMLKIMTQRNEKMIKAADSYLKDGKKVFYVVGSAHMGGETGIVKGLEALGYTVQRSSIRAK